MKQGDPLSPFIFNSVPDPLLRRLEELKGFSFSGDWKLSYLGFSDDFLLISDSRDGTQRLLECTTEYLNALGMTKSPTKCTSFTIVPQRGSWHLTNPLLSFRDGDSVPYAAPDESLIYPAQALRTELVD